MSAMRRALKYILIGFASLVALTGAAIAGLMAYSAIDREDRFYLLDAKLLDPDYHHSVRPDQQPNSIEDLRYGFGVHRVESGKGMIVGYRFYSNGSVMVIDDEEYRKITVWLPSGPPRSAVRIDLADRAKAVVVSSTGGSAWPRSDCSGDVSSGTLHVEPKGDRFVVALDGSVDPSRGGDAYRHCKPWNIDISFEATRLTFDQLTPWLGVRGAHPYEETYR